MNRAVPFFVGFSTALAAMGQTPPDRTRARSWGARLLGASAVRMAVLVGMTLLVGIGISIVTTTDQQWWLLHFSRLGTFKNGSAAFFNGALICGGTLVVVFARAAAREIRAVAGGRVRRGTARLARILFSVVGVNLALVGCVPLNLNGFVHDRVATGMVLGFAGLLLTSPFMMHRMPRRLLLATLAIFVVLFVGAWVFVTGGMNLALFEVIAFGTMFGWSAAFLSALAVCAKQDARAAAEPLAAAVAAVAVDAAPLTVAPVTVAAPAVAAPVAAVAPVAAAAPVAVAAPAVDTVVTVAALVPAAASDALPIATAITRHASALAPSLVVAEAARATTPTMPGVDHAAHVLDGRPVACRGLTVRSGAARDATAGRPAVPHRVPRRPRLRHLAAPPVARARRAPGCRASAARATSERSRTPVRR